jgi:hypothetical protein
MAGTRPDSGEDSHPDHGGGGSPASRRRRLTRITAAAAHPHHGGGSPESRRRRSPESRQRRFNRITAAAHPDHGGGGSSGSIPPHDLARRVGGPTVAGGRATRPEPRPTRQGPQGRLSPALPTIRSSDCRRFLRLLSPLEARQEPQERPRPPCGRRRPRDPAV